MIFYMKLGRVRGLSIEINGGLGAAPAYKKTAYRCETVVDMPYTQVIFTSGAWTPAKPTNEDAANDDTGTGKKAEKV